MDFRKIYEKFSVSIEIFPPKTPEGDKNLFEELDILTKYNPAFISVTYGAGGSTREKTLELALEIRSRYKIKPLVHFTCVGAGRDEIEQHLEKVKGLGLTDILALRGDPPRGQDNFVAPVDGFSHANELVEFISKQGDFTIAVAGYPEKHPACSDAETDIKNLKRKIDAGGSIVMTQLFFDNDGFFRFTEKLASLGVNVPVIPGILPITGRSQIEKFIPGCGAKIPAKLAQKISASVSDEEAAKIGIEYAINQCEDLRKRGAQGLHLYTVNKSYAVAQILDSMGFEKQ